MAPLLWEDALEVSFTTNCALALQSRHPTCLLGEMKTQQNRSSPRTRNDRKYVLIDEWLNSLSHFHVNEIQRSSEKGMARPHSKTSLISEE